jgi:hypothetical protein
MPGATPATFFIWALEQADEDRAIDGDAKQAAKIVVGDHITG